MTAAFDHIAAEYDRTFTDSMIGNAQRNIVWKLLDKEINNTGKKLTILELNCGTGRDAERLAGKGHKVVATDISPEMIRQCELKTKQENLEFKVMSFAEINSLTGKKFDLVFSNFGGLNCIGKSELGKLMLQIHKLLNENGKFIAVIMPDQCLWERGKSLKKGIYNNRSSEVPKEVNLKGTKVKCWYYSPSVIENIAFSFKKTNVHPVGFFIPPSYFENKMKRFGLFFNLLVFLEKKVTSFSLLSRYSDHFYISLKKIK